MLVAVDSHGKAALWEVPSECQYEAGDSASYVAGTLVSKRDSTWPTTCWSCFAALALRSSTQPVPWHAMPSFLVRVAADTEH